MLREGPHHAAGSLLRMVHLRIVVPSASAHAVLALLEACASVINVVHLPGAARKPPGDVVLCDVAREDASVVLADLRDLGLQEHGTIAVENVDTSLSTAAEAAESYASGSPSDAVVWEEVTANTSESATISGGYIVFMVLASLIAAVGILLDSPILVVGAMVVGPEFGPVAGVCVALVQRRPRLAAQSLLALVVGFPLGIGLTVLTVLAFKATGVIPGHFDTAAHGLSDAIAKPDFLAFFVAFCAGIAGMISLSTAKSGALIGVLISVTTIPAAANAGVAAAYGDWATFGGSLGQLGVNISSLLVAGTLTLTIQRAQYARRRRAHRARIAGAA
ncbi:MAG: hypothetical protein JWO02_2722 [Solirubrobacterales bacterium]|nr:hypothetical protein [Solirubrobacterales bacterium]